jgi:anti-anti-sigma factor
MVPRVMRPKGRLDMARAAAFHEDMRNLMVEGSTRLVVDLGEVSFIDCSGLGAIIGGRKLAQGAGGDLRIARPSPQVKAVLELTSINHVLPAYASVEGALADFG